MKKSVISVLCLFLVACGTFAVKVEIVARDTGTAQPDVSMTDAWATTYAAATAYQGDPPRQSYFLTQSAATLIAGALKGVDTVSPRATIEAAQTTYPDDVQAQSELLTQVAGSSYPAAGVSATMDNPELAFGTRVWATIEAVETAYPDDPQSQSPILTQSAATLQSEGLPPTATPTPTPIQATATAWPLQDGQSISLVAIQMSDTSHGWGVETSGHIVKTSDGGWTWKDVTPVEAAFSLHGLFAFNNETAWAVPAQLQARNVVWGTRDGGVTWELSQPIQLGDGQYSPLGLQFPDARHGWLLLLAHDRAQGSRVLLYRSTDGGVDWAPVSNLNDSQMQSYLPDTNTTMAFFDGQTGWLGGWWGKDDPNQWLILKTTDGGTHWGTEELELPKLNGLSCDGHPIASVQPGSMAVEMTCVLAKDPKYLYRHVYYLSTRIMPAWRTWAISGDFLSADFLNASQGWMMVNSDSPRLNEIQTTKDRGKNWTAIGQVSWQQALFDFVDVKDGWAIVGNGFATALVRTENGGKIWVEVRPVAGQ